MDEAVMENKPRFAPNTRVRLKDGVDPDFYDGFSRTGNEGWVRKTKHDSYGYPRVFIQWDKDHWAYNGQEDTWTWEGHFEMAQEHDSLEDELMPVVSKFVKELATTLRGKQPPEESVEETTEEDVLNAWKLRTSEAARALVDSSAFVLICLVEKDDKIYPFAFQGAQTEELGVIAQSQAAEMSYMFQNSLMVQELERVGAMAEDEDDDEDE